MGWLWLFDWLQPILWHQHALALAPQPLGCGAGDALQGEWWRTGSSAGKGMGGGRTAGNKTPPVPAQQSGKPFCSHLGDELAQRKGRDTTSTACPVGNGGLSSFLHF